jgi:capsule biosynthesis phosphatase
MRICLDLDGVVAELRRPDQTYSELAPVPGAVEALKQLKEQGHYLIISTARHMRTCEGNVGAVIARQGLPTLEWLARMGIVVDEVNFGKPYAHVYVDDCALPFSSWGQFKRDFGRLTRKEGPRAPSPLRPPVLVMPAAGRGARLGRAEPKALVDVCGRPMAWWALLSMRGVPLSEIVFVVLEEHDREFDAGRRLQEAATELMREGELQQAPVQTVVLRAVRNGQLLSVLGAREYLTSGLGLLIASCDTLVESPLSVDLAALNESARGLISVIEAPGDNWSFVRVDEHEQVVEVAEKRRVSNLASTGIYYYADASEFLAAAEEITDASPETGGEYYVMPVFGRYLSRRQPVKISRASAMWDMGERSALEIFMKSVRNSFICDHFSR